MKDIVGNLLSALREHDYREVFRFTLILQDTISHHYQEKYQQSLEDPLLMRDLVHFALLGHDVTDDDRGLYNLFFHAIRNQPFYTVKNQAAIEAVRGGFNLDMPADIPESSLPSTFEEYLEFKKKHPLVTVEDPFLEEASSIGEKEFRRFLSHLHFNYPKLRSGVSERDLSAYERTVYPERFKASEERSTEVRPYQPVTNVEEDQARLDFSSDELDMKKTFQEARKLFASDRVFFQQQGFLRRLAVDSLLDDFSLPRLLREKGVTIAHFSGTITLKPNARSPLTQVEAMMIGQHRRLIDLCDRLALEMARNPTDSQKVFRQELCEVLDKLEVSLEGYLESRVTVEEEFASKDSPLVLGMKSAWISMRGKVTQELYFNPQNEIGKKNLALVRQMFNLDSKKMSDNRLWMVLSGKLSFSRSIAEQLVGRESPLHPLAQFLEAVLKGQASLVEMRGSQGVQQPAFAVWQNLVRRIDWPSDSQKEACLQLKRSLERAIITDSKAWKATKSTETSVREVRVIEDRRQKRDVIYTVQGKKAGGGVSGDQKAGMAKGEVGDSHITPSTTATAG